jgi:uncharacterized LabA/DUF88 family protein/Fe-S-cluster formation regulator IscX/YfhJ
MMQKQEQGKIAVLIDGENISRKYIKLIMDEVNEFGTPTYKRVYADFSDGSASSWKDELRKYALTPVFQINYTKNKNASDSAMIIDAMDILYTGNVTGFCIVTSDSDFTKLANRLREAGMLVIGMGEQKTPISLVSACETFKYLDLLYKTEDKSKYPGNDKKMGEYTGNNFYSKKKGNVSVVPVSPYDDYGIDIYDEKIEESILTMDELGEEIATIIELKSDEDGWINQSEIGIQLSKRLPGFDPRNYGYAKLGKLIQSFDFLETDAVPSSKNPKLSIVYVRIK